jgi:predicted ArsR family transcriptional regulator
MNRAIITILEHGPSYAESIAERMEVAVPIVQRHLGELVAAGLVEAARHEDVVLYRLKAVGMQLSFRGGIETRLVSIERPEPPPLLFR